MPCSAHLALLLALGPGPDAPAPTPPAAYFELVALSQLLRESEGGPRSGFYLQLTNKCPNPIRILQHVPEESDAFGPKGDAAEPAYFSGWLVLKPGETRQVFVPRQLPRTYYLRVVEEGHRHAWDGSRNIEVPVELERRALSFKAYDALATCREENGVVVCTHTFRCGPKAP
jgi:hypothetical protein